MGFLVDRDAIKVGRREGKFKAIRLEVSGNAVYMNDLKVVYGNGAPDDIKCALKSAKAARRDRSTSRAAASAPSIASR